MSVSLSKFVCLGAEKHLRKLPIYFNKHTCLNLSFISQSVLYLNQTFFDFSKFD